MFLTVWFLSLAIFWQSSLLLRAGFAINFRERTFVFAFFLGPYVFGRDLPVGFRVFSRMSGLVFLSRSLCLRVWVDDVVCFASLFSLFSFERYRSGLTGHHTHPRTCCCFSFFCPRCFGCLFWPCVLFVLVFLRGAILGPVRFLDSLGTALRPFSWTRGGRGVCFFFCLLFFPLCGFTRF